MTKSMDFTNGKILPKLIKFMLPIMLSLLLQALYGAVDLLIVGRFGTNEGISAISNGVETINLFLFLCAGFSSAVTILLGKYIGENKKEKLKDVIGGGIILFIVLGIFFSLFITLFAPTIAKILKAPNESFDKVIEYVTICGSGLIFIIGYNLMSAIFMGLGDSKRPLFFISISTIVNIILDYIFVAIFKLDVIGAATATVIAQAISLTISIIYLLKKNKDINLKFKNIRFNKDVIDIIKIGFPIAIQETLSSISFIIVLSFVNSMGIVESEGYGVSGRIFNFIFIFSAAIIQSMSSFIAQNYGANREDRCLEALKKIILVSSIIGLIVSIITYTFAYQLSSIFTNNKEILEQSSLMLKGFATESLFTGILFSFNGYFSGHTKTRFVLINGLICSFLVRVPLSYLVLTSPNGNMFYMGLVYPSATIFGIILDIIYYFIFQKKLKRV